METKNINKEKWVELFENYDSIKKICHELFGYDNGATGKIVKNNIALYGYVDKFLSKKEKYLLNPKKCKYCEKNMTYNKRDSIYCNSSCFASDCNKNRITSDDTKLKISKSLCKYFYENTKIKNNQIEKLICCEHCHLNFYSKKKNKYCSNVCRSICVKINMSKKAKERVKNGTHQGWQSRKIKSYPEKFFELVLNNNKIKYENEFKIKKEDLGLEGKTCYFLDFYLPDFNIDLEIDGKQHEYPERKELDKIRDEALIKYGFKVYRIKWKNPVNDINKNYIKNEIDKFLLFCT